MLKNLNRTLLQRPTLSLVLFCILVRVVIILLYRHVTIFPDTGDYIELGKLLFKFNLSGYSGVRTPGYPVLIALSANYLPLTVALQILLGIGTTLYTYKTLLVTGFRTTVALYVATILGNLLHVVFYETNILTETLTLFFITLLTYHTVKLFKEGYKGFEQLFVIGLLCGYLTLIKPFYFFLAPLIYGLYTLNRFSFRKIINPALSLPLLSCITFFGWSYVNYINTGHFVSTTYFGINVAQNCVQFAENVPEEYKNIGNIYARHREQAIKENKDVAMTIWDAQDDLQKETGLSLVELSSKLNDYGRAAIKQNKLGYAKQVLVSWIAFWGSDMYWNYEDFHSPWVRHPFLAIWYITKYLLIGCKIIFLLFTPMYVIRYFKTKVIDTQSVLYALIIVTSMLQAVVAYGTNARYCFPFELLIVISVLLTANGYLAKYKSGYSLLNEKA
jgi:hypothetical protein